MSYLLQQMYIIYNLNLLRTIRIKETFICLRLTRENYSTTFNNLGLKISSNTRTNAYCVPLLNRIIPSLLQTIFIAIGFSVKHLQVSEYGNGISKKSISYRPLEGNVTVQAPWDLVPYKLTSFTQLYCKNIISDVIARKYFNMKIYLMCHYYTILFEIMYAQ